MMYPLLLSFRELNLGVDQIVPLTSEHSGNEILGHFPATFGTDASIIHCAIFSRKKYLASKISLDFNFFSGKASSVVLLSIHLLLHIVIFALLYCFYLNQPFSILIYVKMRCLELITFVKFIKLLFVQKHMSTYRHKTFERLELL